MKKESWKIASLGSKVKFLSGGTPSKSAAHFWNGEIPWVSSAEMSRYRIRETLFRLTSSGAQHGSRLVPKDTVLVVVRGMSLAKECRVAITTKESTFNQDVKALILQKDLDPRFMFYYLRSQRYALRDAASEAAHGTKKLDMSVLEQWPLPIVPVRTQRKIGAILTAYDDLVEANEHRISLLEKMAEEIYREWFVRFRFPGHRSATFKKGLPVSWGMCSVGNSFTITGGATPSKEVNSFWEGGTVNWFTPTDITGANGIFLENSEDQCTEEGVMRSSAKVFPAYSIMMTSRATIGAIGINTTPACTNQGFITCIPNERYPLPYLYQWLKLAKPYFEQLSGGATFPELTKRTFKKLEILTPDAETIEKFTLISMPIFRTIERLLLANRNLEKTRAMLLPRLMSGALSVADLDILFPPCLLQDEKKLEAHNA